MTTTERAPRPGLLLALCLLVVACVYARALEGPFVWDDRPLVTDSEALRSYGVLEWFQKPFWLGPPGQSDSVAYYRPLTSLSFALDFAVHGENSTGFHLTSLLLHLGCTSALFLLLLREGCAPTLTFLLTTCWALLPRLSEAVAWISGRGDALATLFTLTALLVYRSASLVRLVAAVVLAFAALLSKESGAAAFLALGALELGQAQRRRHVAWGRWALLTAPLCAYVALRLGAGANPLGSGAIRPRALSVELSLEALGRYAYMLLDAWQPRSLMGQVTRTDWSFVALGVATALLVGVVAWRARRSWTQHAPAIALVAAPLLMVLHLTPLPVTVVSADRYLHLPAAGLLLLTAGLLQRQVARRPWLPVMLLGLCVSCGVRTFQRAGDYADEARFWEEASRRSPGDPTGWVELSAVAYRAGMFEDGLRLSRRAIPLDVLGIGQALDNAALMAMASGQRELAARLGDDLARSFPNRPTFQLRRAAIALNARDFDTAERFGEAALRLSPTFGSAQKLLRLVEESRRAAYGTEHPALAQRLDMEALRYDAVAARVRASLLEPSPEKPLVAAGVEFMVAHGPPGIARELLEGYRQRFTAEGTEALELAIEERAARARAVHERIVALEGGSP